MKTITFLFCNTQGSAVARADWWWHQKHDIRHIGRDGWSTERLQISKAGVVRFGDAIVLHTKWIRLSGPIWISSVKVLGRVCVSCFCLYILPAGGVTVARSLQISGSLKIVENKSSFFLSPLRDSSDAGVAGIGVDRCVVITNQWRTDIHLFFTNFSRSNESKVGWIRVKGATASNTRYFRFAVPTIEAYGYGINGRWKERFHIWKEMCLFKNNEKKDSITGRKCRK